MLVNEILLTESEKATIIKATRMMKFSLRSGENSLGIDLKNIDCEFFGFGWLIYVGKPGSLKDGVGYDFENVDKAGFQAYRNAKLGASEGFKLKQSGKSYDEFLKLLKAHRDPVVIVDPALTKDAKPAAPNTKEEPNEPENGYFVLGYWNNAYSRNSDKEYFWSGPFFDRKSAMAFGKMKQERGQPKNFRDWVKGTNTIIQGLDKFVAAAKKVGLNPKVDDLEWHE